MPKVYKATAAVIVVQASVKNGQQAFRLILKIGCGIGIREINQTQYPKELYCYTL